MKISSGTYGWHYNYSRGHFIPHGCGNPVSPRRVGRFDDRQQAGCEIWVFPNPGEAPVNARLTRQRYADTA